MKVKLSFGHKTVISSLSKQIMESKNFLMSHRREYVVSPLLCAISAAKALSEHIVSERFARATAMAKKLARLPISTAAKLKAIVSKILPMAMYGVEAANPSEVAIARLTAAFLDCLAGPTKPRDMDAILSKFGYFFLLTITFAYLWAVLFLMPLLACVGPEPVGAASIAQEGMVSYKSYVVLLKYYSRKFLLYSSTSTLSIKASV